MHVATRLRLFPFSLPCSAMLWRGKRLAFSSFPLRYHSLPFLFDAVLALEILEHVVDRMEFLETCVQLLKPHGLIILATLNRTLKSLALAKIGAEYILRWLPPGTHDWNKFVSPETLSSELCDLGLAVIESRGMVFDPLAWGWHLSGDTSVNYMIAAAHP